ncbi:MAG: site-2 protease family protein [Clostridia bacterium]
MQYLQSLLMTITAVFICLSFHEASHAFMAYKLGDNTAKNQGRLTLNPMAHVDFLGLLALIFFHFGWAKPVPVNYRNLKNPKRDSILIALAGPVSNFLLAFMLYFLGYSILCVAFNDFTVAMFQFLAFTASISIGLGIFNFIPIPPLDGSHIIVPFLPPKQRLFLINNAQFIQFGLVLGLYFGFLTMPIYILRNYISQGMISVIENILFAFL